MKENKKETIDYINKWLEVIEEKQNPTPKEAEWIIKESLTNFREHFNAGWLDYRKSVTLADQCWIIPGDCVAVEWKWKWATFQDVLWREYIDFLWGFWMMSHGWWHPDIVKTVQAQLLHTPMPSQELIDPLRWVLARILADITPWDLKYSFFAGSWTEANEWAIKLAKMHTKKDWFIVAVKWFHGKTMWSLSMIWKKDYRQPVWIMYWWPVYHVPFWDAEAVEKQLEICETVWVWIAAVMMEPIQGEAWAIVPSDDFWSRIREATKKHWVLLIADEVQTWLWRTWKLWWVDHWWVVPDIMTIWKALWWGVMPVSAFISTEEIWQSMMTPNPFIHTTTTWGWALACSAAIASINVVLRDDYAKMAEEKWNYIMEKLKVLVEKYPKIYREVTWKGLLIAQHFQSANIGYRVTAELFKNWVLISWTLNSAITSRIEPPIVITYEEIDKGLKALEKALETVSKEI